MPKGYGIVDTPGEIEALRLKTVAVALRLEIQTGMRRSSRGPSTLRLFNRSFGTDFHTKRDAYEWAVANGYCRSM